MKNPVVLVAIFVALVTSAYFLQSDSAARSSRYEYTIPATIGKIAILIDQVEFPDERSAGLSGEKYLKENQGLLFVFDRDDTYGIWMKDMNFPIDVLWLDQNLRVVSVREKFEPSTYPEVAYPSAPARYVLELVSGFVQKHQIKIGDTLSLQ